ncbi:p87/vp80-like [Tropilaelaps mercedesae]|uniref:p87/vp80-like n=1 Tax=Tropilaelaps mercedesae TaxID=418985 RepID=A0A1V9X4I0_9ACAR|nr:p87/vp80-like [Tropilaelaps mercedesae]
MDCESLRINGALVMHRVVPIEADGACLFRALSYLMHGTEGLASEVRLAIVRHVSRNWHEFAILTEDSEGNNYRTAGAYMAAMSQDDTCGGICELNAAGQLFAFVFEVYCKRQLYAKFGSDQHPVKRLRFSSDQSGGHFDVYEPLDITYEAPTSTRMSPPKGDEYCARRR